MVGGMNVKKWLFLLGFSLLIVALTACGSDGTDAGSDADSGSGDTGATDSGEPVTITYFQPGVDQPGTREGIEAMVERFEAANPDIKVELETAGWDDTYQKLVTNFSAGEAPDVIYGGTRWVPAFAAMDGIIPLDDYAAERIQLYHKPLQENVRFNDKIYAIPRAFSARSLIYRSDLIDEPPTTWDELVETAKQVQEENPDMYGFAVSGAKHVSTVEQFLNFLFQNGGDVFDEDGNAILNSPEAVEALQFYADLHLEHQVVPNPLEYNREQLPTLFQEGKIAMYVIGPWGKSMMGIDEDDEETPFATALLPQGKEMANVFGSDSLMISKNSEHPDAAWRFIEFITQPEEQKVYDLDQGMVPIQIEEADEPEFHEDPYFATFVEMVEYGRPAPKPLAWEPFEEIVAEAIQKAFSGEDVQAVLDEAVQKIKEEQLEPKS